MTYSFRNKVALITGGNDGIGKACALAFAKKGATVVIAARRSEESEQVIEELKSLGADALFVKTDVSQAKQVEALINTIIQTYGRLDYAVNNAGILGSSDALTADYLEETWDQVINVNLKGVWLCMKYEIPHLLKHQGAIVNVSSLVGLKGARLPSCAYSASKHGVVGLTKSAALEYATQGLRVNAVCPAVILTELSRAGFGDRLSAFEKMHPLGRTGTPEEVANAIVWLCSDESAFITGIALPIDGGVLA